LPGRITKPFSLTALCPIVLRRKQICFEKKSENNVELSFNKSIARYEIKMPDSNLKYNDNPLDRISILILSFRMIPVNMMKKGFRRSEIGSNRMIMDIPMEVARNL
jgi:hypothetical protein